MDQQPAQEKSQKVKRIGPLAPQWRVSLGAMVLTTGAFIIPQLWAFLGQDGWDAFAIGLTVIVLATVAIGGLLTLVRGLFNKLPARVYWGLMACLLMCVVLAMAALPVIVLALCAMVMAYVASRLLQGHYRGRRWYKNLLPALGGGVAALLFIAILAAISSSGQPYVPTQQGAAQEVGIPDPSQPGTYAFNTLYYASPGQKRQPYPDQQVIESPRVDASGYIDGWNFIRTWRTGLTPQALPLNGQVWMPQGEGPFGLVLMVHGNHDAFDRSDGGYAYLGELLASRGMIAVSVDQNYINNMPFADALVLAPLKEENRARGALLLEHLQQFSHWNQAPESVFYGKVDMQRVGLIGHSRGGEAIVLAAKFAQLGYIPQQVPQPIQTPYTIRALAAIAPVQGQYQPAGLDVQLEGLDYLVLHGAADMDVSTFMGADQYRLITPSRQGMKAAVYLDAANHGQFNTTWGNSDWTGVMNMILRRNQLMPGEQQRQAAKVLIGGLMELSLNGDGSYHKLFAQPQTMAALLPPIGIISDYQHGGTAVIASFEHGVDVLHGDLPGVTFAAQGFTGWTQAPLPAKYGKAKNRVLTLGWDQITDSPTYMVDFSAMEQPVIVGNTLRFSLAAEKPEDGQAVNLTVILTDENARAAEQPLAKYAQLPLPIEYNIYKPPLQWMAAPSEPVLQGYSIPTQDFEGLSGSIVRMQWRIDAPSRGTLYADDIGVVR